MRFSRRRERQGWPRFYLGQPILDGRPCKAWAASTGLLRLRVILAGRGFVSAIGATGLRTLDFFVPQKGCANLAAWHRATPNNHANVPMPDSHMFQFGRTPSVGKNHRKKQHFKLPLTAPGCMLQKLSDNIAECISHALEGQRRAHAAAEPATKREHADMADRWRRLAKSHQFVERIERFLDNTKTIGSMPAK